MAETMMFPATFDEFAEQYGFKDKQEVYTNGSELMQVFRVRQWLDHIGATDTNVGHKSEWISVEERLPRYNDKVLVYRPTMGEKILADTYKGYYNEDTGDWEEGWVNFGQNLIGMNVITHWMPLPEPPEKP